MLALAALIAVSLLPLDTTAQEPDGAWSTPLNFSQHPNTFSDVPILLCDPYQNVHVFWVEREGPNAAIFTRNDVGGTWSNPVAALVTGTVVELAGVIAVNDTAHLLWTTAVRGALTYSRAPLSRTADAKGWETPTVLARDVDSGTLTADKASRLHAIYGTSDFEARMHTFSYIRSDDSGHTWSEPITALVLNTPAPSASGVPTIAIDGKGRLHVTWQVRSYTYGAYSRIGYMNSTNQGHSWSAPLELGVSESPPGVAVPAVFAFGDDEIHLTYHVPDRLHQWSSDGGLTWSRPTRILTLGAAFGGANQLAKDNAGVLHVVAAVGDGVYHATWNSGDGWNAAEAIDRRYYDPHHQQIAVCQGNQLHVVYDDRRGEHEIWHSVRRVDARHIPQLPVPPDTAFNESASRDAPGWSPVRVALGVFTVLLAGAGLVFTRRARR